MRSIPKIINGTDFELFDDNVKIGRADQCTLINTCVSPKDGSERVKIEYLIRAETFMEQTKHEDIISRGSNYTLIKFTFKGEYGKYTGKGTLRWVNESLKDHIIEIDVSGAILFHVKDM